MFCVFPVVGVLWWALFIVVQWLVRPYDMAIVACGIAVSILAHLNGFGDCMLCSVCVVQVTVECWALCVSSPALGSHWLFSCLQPGEARGFAIGIENGQWCLAVGAARIAGPAVVCGSPVHVAGKCVCLRVPCSAYTAESRVAALRDVPSPHESCVPTTTHSNVSSPCELM
jgi:hypothetical protein